MIQNNSPNLFKSEHMPMWVGVIFAGAAITMFLAPTKESAGLICLLVALAIIVSSGKYKVSIDYGHAFKHIAPLFALPIVGLLHLINGANAAQFGFYLGQFVLYLLCYFSLFQLTKRINTEIGERAILVMLLLPGLVHLFIFAVDLFREYGVSVSAILDSAENIKNIPRVGYKYLSAALSFLLVMVFFGCARAPEKTKPLFVFSLLPVAIALALLDSRAALIALAVVVSVVFVIPSFRNNAVRILPEISSRKFALLAYLVSVLAISTFVAYEAGKTRWSQFTTSVTSGMKSDSPDTTTIPINTRSPDTTTIPINTMSPAVAKVNPWLSKKFWDTGCEGAMAQFRCATDSSAYLRSSWLKYGLSGVLNHPMGIGFDREPLRALYLHDHPDADYKDLALRDSHSQLLDDAISFGVVGIVIYAIFFLNLVWIGYKKISANAHSPLYFGIYLVLGGCIARFALDNFNEGLGYYLMSMTGVFVALTMSSQNSIQVNNEHQA